MQMHFITMDNLPQFIFHFGQSLQGSGFYGVNLSRVGSLRAILLRADLVKGQFVQLLVKFPNEKIPWPN